MKSIILITMICMLVTAKYISDDFQCPGCCAVGLDENDTRICSCPDVCECSSNSTCLCPPDCGCNAY
ncbi:unnamed protein product, partial [Brachionus calyciflorus]